MLFVDGNKNNRWRSESQEEQERAFGGYKKSHTCAIIAFCDLYGNFTCLEITEKGAESD